MRFLMYAPAFAPFANPEAFSNNKLALALLAAGHEVDIISLRMAQESDYNYGSGWQSPWLALRERTHELVPRKTTGPRRYLGLMRCIMAGGYAIGGVQWAYEALCHGRNLLERNKYDAIISRAFPLSAHLAGLLLARETKLPWIANWNDPWDYMRRVGAEVSRKGHLDRVSYQLGRSVAETASFNTFPSARLARAMQSTMEGQPKRWIAVPHAGLNEEEDATRTLRPFTFGYYGFLSEGHQPEAFLLGLSLLLGRRRRDGQVRVRLVGRLDDYSRAAIRKLGLENAIQVIEAKSYGACREDMAGCDALLLLDPPLARGALLQSKLSDYAEAKKPVFAIAGQDSATADVIRGWPGAVIAPEGDPVGISLVLEKFISPEAQSASTEDINPEAYFSARRIAMLYESMVQLVEA